MAFPHGHQWLEQRAAAPSEGGLALQGPSPPSLPFHPTALLIHTPGGPLKVAEFATHAFS